MSGRREFLRLSAAGALVAGCSKPPKQTKPEAVPALPVAPTDSTLVRVTSVPTAVEGNLLPELVADFRRASGLRVELVASPDVYDLARTGSVDLAISHYGHKHAEDFVMDGFGEWPRTLFSNQMALVGPKSDPAKVRGLEDVGEAFKRIANSKSPFVMNDIDGVRYLTEILWNAIGCPSREGWLIDDREHRKEDAIRFAAQRGGYTLWGLTPFLRVRNDPSIDLEPLVLADPLLQRMLVSIIVKPSKVAGVNAEGAQKLQAFLLDPATQARIRMIRYPGEPRVTWVPGGRHNRTAMLPKGRG